MTNDTILESFYALLLVCSRANWEQDTYPGGAGRRLTNIMDEHPIYPGAPL